MNDSDSLPAEGRTNHPNFSSPGLWGPLRERPGRPLTNEERAQLAVISSIVRFGKGTVLYREGEPASAVFNLVAGVARAYRERPDGSQYIVGFLFPDDLFGLAEQGAYVNSAAAVTAVTAYRIPTTLLETKLRSDAALEFGVICKLCHELREAQRHAFLLSQRHAVAKIALFLQMLEGHQAARGESAEEVHLPMTRSDIAAYVGVSLEAVSRSFRQLSSRGVIALTGRRNVRILSRDDLEAVASHT